MIGDRDLRITRDTNSTPWLTDIIWSAAKRAEARRRTSSAESTAIEDDHLPFLAAGVPSVDIIDLDYDAVAHRRRHARRRQRPQPADRRRRAARRAAAD